MWHKRSNNDPFWNELKKPYILAEIGTSHGGDLAQAKKLVDAAGESGADGVKFQIIYADEIVHPKVGLLALPTGQVDIYGSFKKLELPLSFYSEISDYCQKKKIDFTASAFGKQSLIDLLKLNPPFIKIASPELNHYPLLKEVAACKKPVLLSTGVSTQTDIQKSLRYLSKQKSGPMALLHCITHYPAPENEYNLKAIETIHRHFKVPCGLSDHSLHPWLVPLLSVAYGSFLIEKHITLSKEDGGLDDPIALNPVQFKEMTDTLNLYSTKTKGEIIEFLIHQFGSQKITEVSGNGKKNLSPSEKKFYATTNRSAVALCPIEKGEPFTLENVALLRSEQNHPAGVNPAQFEALLKRKAKTRYLPGEGVHG